MKKRTTLISGAAVAAVLSLTASLGAVAAPGAAPATAGTGTYKCTLNFSTGVPPCTLQAAPAPAADPVPAAAAVAAPPAEPAPTAAAPVTVLASTGSGLTPMGVPGAWSQTFSDDFNGTALDTSKWSSSWFGGGTMNKVRTDPANVSVGGGNLSLKLSDAGTGSLVSSNPKDAATTGYEFRTGYTEARIAFPGNGTALHNWPAWWTTGHSWPATGENDIAEVLKGKMTSNYHSSSGTHNQGTIAGTWGNEYHTYGLWRKANVSEVYVDGVKVKSFPTDDGNASQFLVLNVGKAGTSTAYGPASEMKVDYVRAWQ